MVKVFDDIFIDQTKNGVKLQTTEYQDYGRYIIVDQGQEQVAGFTDTKEGLFCAVPAIIFGDHTRVIKYVDEPFFLGADGVKVLRSVLPDANYRYLYYALKNARIPNTGYNRHFKWLKKITIRYPCANEQATIVKTLDMISVIIEHRRQQLTALDTLIKARFVEMFGDMADPCCKHPRCKLVEACVNPDDIKCGPFGTQLSKDEYQSSGVAVWEIPQINSGFKKQPTHYLTIEKAKQLNAYSLFPGDIAMSRKGNVGRCGLLPTCFTPGIIHSDVLRIRVDNTRVDPCFMMCQLHFSRSVQQQIEMVSSGAVMAGINVTKLKQIEVYVPAYDLQTQFAAFVAQVDKSKFCSERGSQVLQNAVKCMWNVYMGGRVYDKL